MSAYYLLIIFSNTLHDNSHIIPIKIRNMKKLRHLIFLTCPWDAVLRKKNNRDINLGNLAPDTIF